jgi:ClpP class serine protease
MHSSPLLKRFAGVPALVAPEMQDRFEGCIAGLMAQPDAMKALSETMASNDDFWSTDSWTVHYRPYVVRDGILQIPVKGVLLNNFPYAMGGWATGYEYIWQAYLRGMNDAAVKGIALVCDTPGGMVAGNFDLVDKMWALKDVKPVRGYANESAYSAGFSIITVGTVTVARTGGVGSVGVVSMHVDVSQAMDNQGVKITWIKKGAHKVDGNSYEPLSKAVLKRFEEKMEHPYSIFVATVARNRGMDEDAVRATEAMTFTAPEAVANGFADSIGAFDDALAAFAVELSNDNEEEDVMSATTTTGVDQATHDAAVTAARAEGVTAGKAEGVQAERTRISAIVGLDEAKDRQPAALVMALTTDLSSDQAKGLLAALPAAAAVAAPAAPAAAAATGDNGFAAAMQNTGNPDLGADGGGDDASVSDDDAAATSILASIGRKPAKAA